MTIEKCAVGAAQTDLEKINLLTEEIKNLAEGLKGKAHSLHPSSEKTTDDLDEEMGFSPPPGVGPTLIHELRVIQRILSDAMSALAVFV